MKNKWAVDQYEASQRKGLPLREDRRASWIKLALVIIWGGVIWAVAMAAIW